MMRKMVSVTAAVVLMLSLQLSAFAASDSQIVISLGGAQLNAVASTAGDTLYLPVRSVCEALGYQVAWSKTADAATVTVTGSNKNVILDLTNQKITDNGHVYYAYGTDSDGCKAIGNSVYLESGLLSECFGVDIRYDKDQAEVFLSRLVENPITITTMKMTSESDDLDVNLQYPQIGGLSSTEAQDTINSVLREAAVNCVNEGFQNAYDLKSYREETPENQDYNPKCGSYFDYEVKYNQNGLLSVILLDYQYAGGAHGSTLQMAYTFDLNTGKELSLADLMNANAGYTSYINSAVRTEIDKRVADGDLYEFEDGKFKTIGDDPACYLSENGLVIYFQEYEYFPYAAGIQEFNIPYSGLKDMLKDQYGFLYGEAQTLNPAPAVNELSVGRDGTIVLKGNPTTGYAWHYTIENSEIMEPVSDAYVPDSNAIGAGGTYTWTFRALKKGQTKIVFTYYRDSDGRSTADQTAVYSITVN